MRKYIIGGLSLITALADIWIWAYVHGLKGYDWWGETPLFLTGILVLGICLLAFGKAFEEIFSC